MSNLKKIIAWISVFAISISLLSVPAFASSGSAYDQKTGFWDWVTHNPVSEWAGLSDLLGYTFGAYCPTSGDGYHHANTFVYDQQNGYYDCICTYCGHHFTAYETDFQQSYDNYVSELPATGYNSAGALLWSPYISSFAFVFTGGTYYCNHITSSIAIQQNSSALT